MNIIGYVKENKSTFDVSLHISAFPARRAVRQRRHPES